MPRRGHTTRPGAYVPGARRVQRLAAALAVLAVLVTGTLGHAALRRSRWRSDAPTRRAAARSVGTTDLALSSTSRWLRHPSLSEPFAPFADGPAVLDPDPAGALLAPPREAFDRNVRGDLRIRRQGTRTVGDPR